MATALSTQIRMELRRYLVREISLATFDTWFTPATWNAEQSGDKEAEWLADEIMLRLAEFSRGHWTEDQLRDHLAKLQPQWLGIMTEPASSADTAPTTVPWFVGPRFRPLVRQDSSTMEADVKEFPISA